MKSHVSNLLTLLQNIVIDVCRKCAVDPDLRDFDTLKSRAEHEGLSFFTITLPTFGKSVEHALSVGKIGSLDFRSFKKFRAIPAFLQGMTSLVFDPKTGGILDDPKIEAIEGIRQICLVLKKLEIPCAAHRIRAALEEFKSIERSFQDAISQDDITNFCNVSDLIWPNILVYDRDTRSTLDMKPKHGPGATAEKLSGNQKFNLVNWHRRLEGYFPLLNTVFSSENAVESTAFEKIVEVAEDREQPVRVIPVPKTLKTPRIIAIEPVCMQYCQQAISQFLVKRIESADLTRGHVNFTDQTVNQRLALSSSASEFFATLDLSSASDRVPFDLAIRMFDSNPELQGAVEATRSKKAQMPDGEILHLAKFASMGSALCFPVEAMYFYTICVAALIELHNLPVTYQSVINMGQYVYVYGDDIVVPRYAAAFVAEHLQKFHCKVNSDKSFWNGKFRESCGVDAYAGEVVTPTYVKQLHPSNKREAKNIVSWVKTANAFYKKGMWLTSDYMFSVVESIIGALPIVGPLCSGLGKVSFQHLVSTERWNKRFQAHEVRAWCAVPVYQEDILEGYPALTKCLSMLEARQSSQPETSDGKHLHQSARHGALALKRRWISPY